MTLVTNQTPDSLVSNGGCVSLLLTANKNRIQSKGILILNIPFLKGDTYWIGNALRLLQGYRIKLSQGLF